MLFILLFLISLSRTPEAQEIVVEASKLSADRIEDSRSVTIVDDQLLQIKKPMTVADILREVPGVEVVRQGAVGQTTSVFIRGSRSEDTLVLIDGLEVNDAGSPAGGFDFSTLSADSITKIEVYRGPQSVRFGAGALGGVINIITKEGNGPFHTNYAIETGSYNTRRGSLGASGRQDSLAYAIGYERFKTEGFSAANQKYGNTEKDGTETNTASSKLAWHFDKSTKFETMLRYQDSKVDLDNGGGIGADDPNNISKSNQLMLGLVGHKRFFNEHLKSKLGFYRIKIKRFNQNDMDSNSTSSSTDDFDGESKKIETNQEFALGESHRLRLDIQWRSETASAQSVFNTSATDIPHKEQSVAGKALTYLYDDENWFGDIGIRSDQHSIIGTVSSYRASLGKMVFDHSTKVIATYGTGFKPPSLYQLYSSYGNRDLKHESSNTTELSLQRQFNDKLSVSVTYFRNSFNNRIDYDIPSLRYFNISKVKSSGVELQSNFKVQSNLEFNAQYTYLEALNENTGEQLIRIPKNTWSLSTHYKKGKLESFVQYRYKGDRVDFDQGTNTKITQRSYNTFDIGGAYWLSKSTKLTARIENIFNQAYEEVAGYGTPGFVVFIGLAGEM